MIWSRLDRYVLTETVVISLMTLAVLLSITLALFLAELLGDVSQGQAASAQVFRLLALRIPEALLLIGPLALMLGLLMALGQLAQQHELGVFRASGLTPLRLMRPILMLAAPWALVLFAIAGWASPWAYQQTVEISRNLAEELLIGSVRPGQFTPIGSNGLSIYVEHIDDQNAALENIFIYYPESDGVEIISARNGLLLFDADQERRVLTLYDGIHLRHAVDDGLPMRRIAFARNDFHLPSGSSGAVENPLAALSLQALAVRSDPAAQREWHWRLAPAIAALLLVLLTLPVTLERPRGNRFGLVIFALVFYLLYSNAAHISLAGLERSGGWAGLGLWPLHALVLTLLMGFWLRWYRQW